MNKETWVEHRAVGMKYDGGGDLWCFFAASFVLDVFSLAVR
jgi:hypothetical protein